MRTRACASALPRVSVATWGSMPRTNSASRKFSWKNPLSAPSVRGVKCSRRFARSSKARHPVFSAVLLWKISTPSPTSRRWRFSLPPLTGYPPQAPPPALPLHPNPPSRSLPHVPPPEVGGPIAPIGGPVLRRLVLGAQPPLVLGRIERDLDGHEALEARIGVHQRPVDADVPAHQPRGHRSLDRVVEQLFQEARLVEAPAPVLTERRGVPRVLVEIEPDEPPQGHVALQLHDQLPLAGDPEQVAAHQRQEHLLGWDRRPADGRVQGPAGASDRRILNERPNGAQGMLRRDEAFQRELVEQRPLRIGVSHHPPAPPCSQPTGPRGEGRQETSMPSTLSATC